MRIGRDEYEQLLAHARDEAPNECCAVVGMDGDRAASVYPARNRFASPMRFELHPEDLLRIYTETEQRGEQLAIFHSHPKTEAYPSQTDINLARGWPGALWLICSLAGEPVVRVFEIDGDRVEEVELVVD
jgi:proteasome lid subunit RPN8/RPN11